jgi:predicted membrane channel-forming protein YqfA (hemolysin III family)
MVGYLFVFLAPVFLFVFNSLTYKLCDKKNLSVKQEDSVYRTINISITILLISSYISNVF